MILKKVIILIFVFLSLFSDRVKNLGSTFSINQFNSSSLIISQTLNKEKEIFEQNKPNTVKTVEDVKQNKLFNKFNENDLFLYSNKVRLNNTLNEQKEKTASSQKKKTKIKRRQAKDLLTAYKEARIKIENQQKEELSRLQLGYYDKVIYRPRVFLSKNYWIYKLFPNKVYKMAQNSENPNAYLKKFQKSYKNVEKATKDEIEVEEKRLEKKKQQKIQKIRDLIYDVKFGFHNSTSDIKPDTLRNVEELHYRRSAFKKYYQFSWSNVIKYGPTIKEVENVLIIIAFVRFCIYTIRYDVKTSFIICSIGLISSFVYISMLTDALVIPFERLYLCPSFFRFLFEESLYRDGISDYAFLNDLNVSSTASWKSMIKATINDYLYRIRWWWADEIIDSRLRPANNWLSRLLVDSPITSYITQTVTYVQKVVIPYCGRVLQGYKYNLKGLITYYIVLRLGKEIVPYHIQWHVMFYCLYMNFGSYVWDWYRNSQELLQLTFIPQYRYSDINLMNLFHSTFIGIFVYLIMLAMLHAVFSQYFYIPLWVPNMEAHIGKRSKDDIYSGGYTSWQDEIRFWEPGPADLKLWFGILGKGPNDKKTKRKKRKNNKKPK